jgi:N6-adenosine-specific RNA methylase IME4
MSRRYRTIVADPPWEIGAFPANLHVQNGGTNPVPYETLSVAAIEALPVRDLAAVEAHLYLWTTAGFLRPAFGVAEAWGFEPMYPLVWCKAPKGRGLGGKFQSNVEFCLFCRDREGALRITSYLADAAEAAGFGRRDIDKAMGTSDMAGWWLSRIAHRAKVPTWDQWCQLKSLIGFDDRYDDEIQGADEERRSERRCNTRWWEWPRGEHSAKPEAFLDIVEQVSPGPYLELFARRARFGWDYWGDQSLGTAELAA